VHEYKISLKKLLCAHTRRARWRRRRRTREGKENSTALKFTTPGGKVPAEKLRLLNPNEIKATQRSHRSYFVCARERERAEDKKRLYYENEMPSGRIWAAFRTVLTPKQLGPRKKATMHFGKQNDVDKFLGCEIQGEKTWRYHRTLWEISKNARKKCHMIELFSPNWVSNLEFFSSKTKKFQV